MLTEQPSPVFFCRLSPLCVPCMAVGLVMPFPMAQLGFTTKQPDTGELKLVQSGAPAQGLQTSGTERLLY